jgi:hypothetical protein
MEEDCFCLFGGFAQTTCCMRVTMAVAATTMTAVTSAATAVMVH